MPDVLLTVPQPTIDAVQGLLTATGAIVRPRVVDDGAGSTMPDPAGPLTTAGVAYALAPRSGRELLSAERLRQIGSYVLSLPPGTDIRPGDQFTTSAGTTYNVVFAPEAGWPALLREVGVEEAP